MHILKPFDVVVALKIGLNEQAARQLDAKEAGAASTNSVGDLAESLFKAKGDVSRSINRLIKLGLVAERRPRENDVLAVNRKYYSVQRNALSEILCYGIRHFFAPEKTGFGRGVPTGWNCPSIGSHMNPPDVPLVWAMVGGSVQGEFIEPLYAKAPEAAMRDPRLYELLALVEVIRTGKPRELTHAKDLLIEKVKGLHS